MYDTTTYIREDLVKEHSYFKVITAENVCHYILADDSFIVYEWSKAPNYIKEICQAAGGDEDWVVLVRQEPEYMPNWVEKMGNSIDIYKLNGVVIYVASH